MTQLLDTILLFSLPASGKSEVRRYLASLTPDQCRNDFHMGPTLQLDDYPYVHLMHRIDDELKANGLGYAYYHGPSRPFRDNWTWAVLIELLNEDHANLMASRQVEVASAASTSSTGWTPPTPRWVCTNTWVTSRTASGCAWPRPWRPSAGPSWTC
ncbi:MAG: hypothetical protein IPO28_11975 [Holophagaceae bacterium]|nr:hypothetical protein [Holophagaceae bacterium]